MSATLTRQKPLDRLLAAFPEMRQRNNGWWYNADSPRFDALELPNGDIRIHSWTGRSVDDVLAMGDPAHPIRRAQLYARPGQKSEIESRDKLDLLTLAQYMGLDWQFLQQDGYSDEYSYTYSTSGKTVRCVKVGGCFTPDGHEHSKIQVRLSCSEEPRFLFDQNTPGHPFPFGLHRLNRAREAGYLVIGEGSSDYATMAWHGIPFIGIPGASHAGSLDVELLQGIPTIYIIEEPDQVKSLKSRGMGFYKSVRKHLRANGYEGDIFSIRFEEATGFKDPSDLHKAMYRECKEAAEGTFRQEVKRRFLEVIEQALENAIPEGNTNRSRALMRDLAHLSFEEFYREVWSVPTSFLSPIQKGLICYLFLYMRDTQPGELGWHFDAAELAERMGFIGPKGVKTLQTHISYLHQKMGILDKSRRARKEYINNNEGPERVRYTGTDIYLQPTSAFFSPRGYCVPLEAQHQSGGPRVPLEVCDQCGGQHLKHYARQCVECGHVMYPPIEDDPEPVDLAAYTIHMVSREEADPEPQPIIESTVEYPLEETEPSIVLATSVQEVDLVLASEEIPEVPNLGTSDKECITWPQIGYFGESAHPLPGPSHEETLATIDAETMKTPPAFCQPESTIWTRLVERDGLQKTRENARAWYRLKGWQIPPGVLREQVAS